MIINGVVWVLLHGGHVLLEKCPKKRQVLGVGEWFLPGGKIEGAETPEECLLREVSEEWPGVVLLSARPLPIIEGSAVPPGPRGVFLMQPYVIQVSGDVPYQSDECVPLQWVPVVDALYSPVVQVRMILAGAING